MTISRTQDDAGIATLVMDDGKVNAFDLTFFTQLDAAFDDCADATAVVLAGRPGMFSAGLNMKVMAALDDDGMVELLTRFGQTMLRVWLEPRPVVGAITGHAIAGGTILAMTCDHAVAAAGDFRWGLTETTIGFPLPAWIIALARGNVSPHRLDDLLLPGRMVGPDEAVEVGFADAVTTGNVMEQATQRAQELAALPLRTYAETKRRLRGATARAALDGVEQDIRGLLGERTVPTA